MPGVQVEEESKTDRLKSALWYSIGQTIDAISLDTEQNINASPQFIGALTELVWNQIQSASQDVEAFTKHAGRNIVDTQDVMLLARRNESLAQVLQSSLDAAESTTAKRNKQ